MSDTMSSSSPSSLNRRLLVGAAVAAGMAGAGLAWWRQKPVQELTEAEATLWSLSFDTPTGGSLAMASMKGRPVLLNFWATWCPPCVEELPMVNQFYQQNAAQGWQVVGVAVDKLPAVQGFLQKTPVTFPVGLAGLNGTALGRSLGNLAGGLPFTVVLGAAGNVLHRKMGRLSADDLRVWSALK